MFLCFNSIFNKQRKNTRYLLYENRKNQKILFISFPTIAFDDLFSNTVLLVLSGITAIYLIISFIVLLFNKYNQTLSDLSSQTILIATEDLDSIYRLKGTNNG